MFLVQFLNALSYSVILFLLSSGLALMFGLMNIVNLSHGTLYMISGYVGYSVAKYTNSFIIALIGGIACAAFLSFLIERGLLRYLKVHLNQILVSFGLIYVLLNLARDIWGGHINFVDEPALLSGTIQIFGVTYSAFRCFLILIGLSLATALWLLEAKTKIGAIIRAGVDDLQMLEAMGKNAKLIFTLIFAFGGALAGLGGVLGSVLSGASLGVADEVLILSLVILVIGGIGSLKGAMLGSLIIGFADVFGKAYLPELAYFLVFCVMVVVLVVKPSGLLGEYK
jgi:branched-chain amino acid transport system permease protein